MELKTFETLAKAIAFIFLMAFSVLTYSADPYYGYFPSRLGPDWKLLKHNIFGFSIDIPSNWSFGVVGQPPTAVIMLYPESMDPSKLSVEWGVVEVGTLPIPKMSLNKAANFVITGMRQFHSGASLDQQPLIKSFKGNPAIHFQLSWSSKTGLRITEKVSLVQYRDKIFSVTSKAVNEAQIKNGPLYTRVVNSFIPFQPSYQ